MAASKDNYQVLIEKLDRFTRKFYINQLIRGVLYAFALILAMFILLNVLEYNFYFSKGVRKGLFYSFLGISALSMIFWVFIPLLKYFRLGKVISREKAASIIGEHFTDVKDKLLNILQLKSQAGENASGLVMAGINQKTEDIKLVPFRSAINLSQNKKYLRYALPPLLLLLVMLFAAPSIIKDGTNRLINNDKEFERAAPFHFLVEKEELTVIQFEDYLLTVVTDGEVNPNEVFIDIDNYHYRLNKESDNTFTYRFSNVQKDTDFKVFSGNVLSEEYKLNVLKKPNIVGFEIKLDYPGYTKRKDETLANIGDIVVPIGTNIDWVFNAQNTDDISIKFSDSEKLKAANRFSDELFTLKKRALKDQSYKLYVSNQDLPNADSIVYAISTIPDLNPTINVERFVDSTDSKLVFFVGQASDDYGLLSLSFNYQLKKNKGAQQPLQSIKLDKPSGKQISYDHTFDIQELTLEPGDELTYYFEVFDNDAVNGNKSARTNLMKFEMPTVEEFEEMADQNNDEIKKDLEDAMKESKKIQEDMKKLREKLLQEKDMDWQSRKELEKLLERQKELENQINQAKENFDQNLKNQEEFSKPDEEILEKQEKIQEMMDEVMSDEMKELMKQIEDLLQELDKDEALEMMEDMEMDDEQLEDELDRMLELFKQLEVEKDMQDQIDKLEELAKEEEQLAEDTENGTKSQEELKEKQEEIQEEFDKVQEKMDEIMEKNEELENPKNIDDQEEEMEDIEQDMKDSQEQLDQKQNDGASKKQKSAAQKMKDMAAGMQMDMEAGEQEQMEEDIAALKQLLENLVTLSFGQEDLMGGFTTADINTPHYVDLVQEQYQLKDDFKMIEDSLQALSKRVYQIESFVTEKVTEIKVNMKESLEELEERKKQQADEHQQRTMKNVNDLALMLSEVMSQMQQQMGQMMSGSQMCNKPGGKGSGSKPSDKISQGQGELNEQMKKMAEGMKNGKGGDSKKFAEMAAKQAALREALRKKQQKSQEQGKGNKELEELIEQMDKIETDLVNKRLTTEMMKRQEEIMTRLLKAEKAERQREYDNKRKSESAEQQERKMPAKIEQYIKKREAEIEMYKTVSPALKPYYKYLVEEYFKSLKKQ